MSLWGLLQTWFSFHRNGWFNGLEKDRAKRNGNEKFIEKAWVPVGERLTGSQLHPDWVQWAPPFSVPMPITKIGERRSFSALKEEIAPCTRLERRDFYTIDSKNAVCMEEHIYKRHIFKIHSYPYTPISSRLHLRYHSNKTATI